MSYQFNPTYILLQFLLQTGMVVALAIYFIPIIHDIILDSDIYHNIQTPSVRLLVDQLWIWTIVFFVGGMAGNVLWFLRAMQARQVETRSY